MKKLLLLTILLLLYHLSAKATFSSITLPFEDKTVLSLYYQDHGINWDFQARYSRKEGLILTLPARYKIEKNDLSLAWSYPSFWQEFLLAPSFSSKQGFTFTAGKRVIGFLLEGPSQHAIGYEQHWKGGVFSLFSWRQSERVRNTYQTQWGEHDARWAAIGKVVLSSSVTSLRVESLFNEVQGLEFLFAGAVKVKACSLSFIYGQNPYPLRYELSVDLQSRTIKAHIAWTDVFGPPPLYGGTRAIRTQKQAIKLTYTGKQNSLTFSYQDVYEYKYRGTEESSTLCFLQWSSWWGKFSIESKGGRTLHGRRVRYAVTLYRFSLNYDGSSYSITLSHSFAMGRGKGTWKVEAKQGKPLSCTLAYDLTIDQ